ncbi:MAG: sulfite exporter TauE/SafE family protein [Desulfatiglandales bacterium]
MYLHLLALMLGFKHSYDADHLVAVSNFLVKSKSRRETFWMSMSWATGHMLTASIVTILIFQFKDFFLTRILSHFELVVGAMLVVLGLVSILSTRLDLLHIHSHTHDDETHEHPHVHISKDEHYHSHMFGIGIVHGLASNDELLILFTAALGISSLAGLLSYVAIFSVGVIGGMILFGYVVTVPLSKINANSLNKMVSIVVGSLSIVYGLWLLRPSLLI